MMNEEESYLLDFLVKFMNEKYPEESNNISIRDALEFIRRYLIVK